jgi:hypothetical protein
MLHKLTIYMIICLIWGLVLILGVNVTFREAVSVDDIIIDKLKQMEIVNAYNAEIVRCDNLFTDNSPSWSECLKNASLDFEIDLLDEEHYLMLRSQLKSIIEN